MVLDSLALLSKKKKKSPQQLALEHKEARFSVLSPLTAGGTCSVSVHHSRGDSLNFVCIVS